LMKWCKSFRVPAKHKRERPQRKVKEARRIDGCVNGRYSQTRVERCLPPWPA